MLAAEAAGADEAASTALLCARLCGRCEEAAYHAQREMLDTAAALEASRASVRSAAAKSVGFEEALVACTQLCAALSAEQAVVIQSLGGSMRDAEAAAEDAADAAAAAAMMAGQAAAAAADAAAALAAAERQRPSTRGGYKTCARPRVEAAPTEGTAPSCSSRAKGEAPACETVAPSGAATPPARPSLGLGGWSACESSGRSLPGSSRLVELTRGRPLFSSPSSAGVVCARGSCGGSPEAGWGCLNSPGAEGERHNLSPQPVSAVLHTVNTDDSSTLQPAAVPASAPLIPPPPALSPPPPNAVAGPSGFPPPRRRPLSAARAPRPASTGRPTPATTLRPRSAADETQRGDQCTGGRTPEREGGPARCSSTGGSFTVRARSFERPVPGDRTVRHALRPAIGRRASVGARHKREVLVRRTEGGGAFSRLVPVTAAAANAAGRGLATARRR